MDPSSLQVDRRARRAKADRLDAAMLPRTSHDDPSSWRWRLVDGAFWAWWRAGRPDWTC
jgi:hypothetical protein